MAGPIAILGAMDEEISAVQSRLSDARVHEIHGQRFVQGFLVDTEVVTGTTGYGKVAAAATTAGVVHLFKARSVVFGGVAGGIDPRVSIGDVIIADHVIQHDYDASPLFARHLIPSLGVAEIPTDPALTGRLMDAAARCIEARQDISNERGIEHASNVRLHRGLIASGDQFISDQQRSRELHERLPGVLAVEMEGAAVAQVCAERRIPVGIFRLISDRADQDAEVDFMSFISTVAAPMVAAIVEELLGDLR